MINPQLEMRPIARRGPTAEEIELNRYAATELKGSRWCLFANGHTKDERKPGEEECAARLEDRKPASCATACPHSY